MKILVAEDEPQLLRVLTVAMQKAGYEVDPVDNGLKAVEHTKENSYDVIILDIMMPVMDGITALKKIRKSGDKSYILMLTAKSDVADKIHGLNIGADDYLTKPFQTEELIARIRALTRRQGTVVMDTLSFSDLILDLKNYSLSCGEKTVGLGFKEFEIMRILMSNPKQVIEKETIISKVWGLDSEATDNNIEAYISFL